MAIATEGKKLKGRFIKKNSKILEHVALSEFDFSEVCETASVHHDNVASNIIHQKYHLPEDIEEGVRHPEAFDENFMGENSGRPVLVPIDFTRQWLRDLKRQKDRVAAQNFEDDFLFDDFEASYEEEAEKDAADRKKIAEQKQILADAKENGTIPEEPGEVDDGESPRSQFESIDFAGKVIKNIQSEEQPVENLLKKNEFPEVESDSIKDPVTEQMEAAIAQANDPPESNQPAAGDPEPADDFIPTNVSSDQVSQPEKVASDQYRLQLENHAEELEKALEHSKAQGYEEGFRLGEEKAALQSRGQAQEIFGKLGELFGEFGSLKQEVLGNVQQNFYEICQAIAESLLKREFDLSPQAFSTVVRKAIEETVEGDKFKVRVHPSTLEKLQALGDSSLITNMVVDESVPEGDFKIESDLAVVDGSVGKLVRDLLDRADIDLFDTEKAG